MKHFEPSEYSTFFQGASSGDRGASVAIVTTLGRGGIAVLIAGVILAVAFAVAAFTKADSNAELIAVHRETMAAQKDALEARIARAGGEASMAKQQAELLQYYVLHVDNLLVTRGYLKPEETFSAQQQRAKK